MSTKAILAGIAGAIFIFFLFRYFNNQSLNLCVTIIENQVHLNLFQISDNHEEV
jgi:hypothetical protein